MISPGNELREAREDRGLSLVQASALTRIPRTTLAHLEADRFGEFNAAIFVRGHLRNYARELGLDSERLVAGYERTTGVVAPAPKLTATLKSKEKQAEKKSAMFFIEEFVQRFRPTHMLAVALVLVGVVIFASLVSGNRATATDPATFPTTSEQAWEMEQDAQETRWLLEQPVSDSKTK